MAMNTTDLGKFPKGINNIAPETNLPEGSLRSAINVDIDKEGNVRRRYGYTKVYSGKGIHSLYKGFFVEGSDLKALVDGDLANPYTISTGLNAGKFLAWEEIHDELYYTDGTNNRTITHEYWGIPTPPANPSLKETSGKLSAGTYQVTICYIDPRTGELSGALLASTITVSDNSGIVLDNLPISNKGFDVVIYCSTTNGEELYKNSVVLNGIDTFTIFDSQKSTRILDTQFMEPLPGGHIIRHFKARMYVARDNVLWYSEAFRYGLHKTSKNFFQFPSKISIVQPVEDGVYVVADKTYFLSGTEPKSMQQITVSKDSGIEGTGISVDSAMFGMDGDNKIGFWYSTKGAVIGMDNGKIVQLTENSLALDSDIQNGVSAIKEDEGIRQVVTNFSNKGKSSQMKYELQLTSKIIRNGVVIED